MNFIIGCKNTDLFFNLYSINIGLGIRFIKSALIIKSDSSRKSKTFSKTVSLERMLLTWGRTFDNTPLGVYPFQFKCLRKLTNIYYKGQFVDVNVLILPSMLNTEYHESLNPN